MEGALISIKDVKKLYPTQHLNQRLYLRSELRRAFGSKKEFESSNLMVALENISLEVHRGQSLAVIGRNGAGKSTLLKIIQGVISPNSGSVKVKGKVGGLIELTAGFQEELSGHQNVLNKAAQLALSKAEIRALLIEIEAFADIGEHFTQPVKTYSSGMKARVGFAIAVSLPYDVMLCDEALSVGDALFQQKCFAKINAIKSTRAFIFVSHSMHQVRRFCQLGIVLEAGKMRFFGDVDQAGYFYETEILHLKEEAKPVDVPKKLHHSFFEPLFYNKQQVSSVDISCKYSANGHLHVKGELLLKPGLKEKIIIGIPILNEVGDMVTGMSLEDSSDFYSQETGKLSFSLTVDYLAANPGLYFVMCAIHIGMEKIYRQAVQEINVQAEKQNKFGYYTPVHRWGQL